MNTRQLMTGSAVFLGVLGVTASFLPQEIAASMGMVENLFVILLLQILGAAWIAMALLNWMARGNLIGGIYSRPVAMGNMAYFMISTIVLLKAALKAGQVGLPELVLTIPHLIFAVLFAYVAFTHPRLRQEEKTKA